MTTAVGTLSGGEHLTMDRGAVIMSDVNSELPDALDHGMTADWAVVDRDGIRHEVSGTFLGIGSTHRPYHKNHPETEWAPKRVHCSTCRWTEIRLFRLDDGRFCVINCGASDVPGERDLIRVSYVDTAFEVVEFLTVTDRGTQNVSLPMPARRALAMSAGHDASVRDAYINSPVT